MKRFAFLVYLLTILIFYQNSYSINYNFSLPNNFKNPNIGKILQKEKKNIKPRIVLFQDGTKRNFYFENGVLSFFLHYSAFGTMLYKFVPAANNEYVVYYYNEFEWITKLIYFKNCGGKTVTHFRKMKRAFIIEYNKNGKIIFSGEY